MKQVHWLVAKQSVERRVKNKENQSVETKNWLLERKASPSLSAHIPHTIRSFRCGSAACTHPHTFNASNFANESLPHIFCTQITYSSIILSRSRTQKCARVCFALIRSTHTHPHTFTNCILDDTLQPKPLWHWVPSFAARSYVATRARIFVRRSKASNSIPCKAAGKQKL
jgi:hypothetical protein